MHRFRTKAVVFLVAILCAILARRTDAHCDTLDGPVVMAAKAALQDGDVASVLKWVRASDETEVREVFGKTLKVRRLSDEARELADLHFFETLVRLHRASEGMAYTGLKPAGTIDPSVVAADEALARGSVDALAEEIAHAVAAGIRSRFARVVAAKAHADESVESGRAFVAAYVQYVHFVEAVHALVGAGASEHHH